MEYIHFKPTRITADGVKLARFDEIHYNGALSECEEAALTMIKEACSEARVELYCSQLRYDRFLNDIMTDAQTEGILLSQAIRKLQPGAFYLDGTELRPLTITE